MDDFCRRNLPDMARTTFALALGRMAPPPFIAYRAHPLRTKGGLKGDLKGGLKGGGLAGGFEGGA